MKVVICGVGNEKGFFSACKGVEHRHRVYGIDSQDLNEIKYQELVKDAPNCYFKQVDMEKELNLLWEIAEIKPDMVIDCTRYPKETEALQKACQKKHWEYKRV